MTARKVWLAFDWDAPAPALEALASYVANVTASDPLELAIPSGDLTEAAAGDRFIGLAQADPRIAARWLQLPEIVVYAGPIPDDVAAADRLLELGPDAGAQLRQRHARFVAVTPVLNQVEWARTFDPQPGFRHLILDNASDDGTADVLEERGATVIRATERVGRVDNWKRAAQAFVEHTDGEWMKWVFAGDGLLPGAAGILGRGLAKHPEVKIVASEYEWRRPDGVAAPYCSLDETRIVHPPESAERFAIQGNWLGGPVALLLHRDVIGQLDFGHHPFVGDWQASMEVALRNPVLYLKEGPIGYFDAARDRYHTQRETDLYTSVQDAAMRYQALMRAGELSPEKDFTEIRDMLDQRFTGVVLARAKQHGVSGPRSSKPPRSSGSKKRARAGR